jgi:hypothetical protein
MFLVLKPIHSNCLVDRDLPCLLRKQLIFIELQEFFKSIELIKLIKTSKQFLLRHSRVKVRLFSCFEAKNQHNFQYYWQTLMV